MEGSLPAYLPGVWNFPRHKSPDGRTTPTRQSEEAQKQRTPGSSHPVRSAEQSKHVTDGPVIQRFKGPTGPKATNEKHGYPTNDMKHINAMRCDRKATRMIVPRRTNWKMARVPGFKEFPRGGGTVTSSRGDEIRRRNSSVEYVKEINIYL